LLAGAPANPFLLDLAGSVEMGRGRPAKAVRRFQEALTTGGERLPLQGRLAEAFLAAGRPAESATTASAFVRASPGALEGRLVVVLCRALMALGRGDEARTVARRLEARLSATDPYRNHLRLVMQGETVALPAENPGATPVPW